MKLRNRHSVNRNSLRQEWEIPYPTEKVCSQCKILKVASDFNKAKREKDGLKSYCRQCTALQVAKRYSENRDREILRTTEWQKAHPEYTKEKARKTYYKNHASRRARANGAYEANKDSICEAAKGRYDNDEEYRKRKQEQVRRSYAKRAAKVIEYQKKYAKENPEKIAAIMNNRRTRIKNSPGTITAQEWIERLEEFNHCCAYCLRPESAKSRMTMDHMMPLSQGGTNDIDNIVPACRPCNSSKNKKNLLEYLAYKSVRISA